MEVELLFVTALPDAAVVTEFVLVGVPGCIVTHPDIVLTAIMPHRTMMSRGVRTRINPASFS
ncbi:MAG TPA: hypothetical protein VEF35_01640 [Candidatus Bathyarchaeia archaeon]|nr:hypothetical protein [Candidatus Bathyarchaeia archaeon]